MARVAPFHTSGPQPVKVYHDDDTCPNGQSILAKNQVAGSGGYPKCAYCRGDAARRAGRRRRDA